MSLELSKEQKVLLALYRLWKDGHKKVRYEDIVVRTFKDYSADFHLKGYPEYPDTGDAVHKPLYDYRKRGMVTASNKMFSLTPHGVAEAERLRDQEQGKPSLKEAHHRLERNAQIEFDRIKQLESFKLFLSGKQIEIIDSDLFEYLGVSVRSTKNEFIGRLETMKAVTTMLESSGIREPAMLAAVQFANFMMTKFANDIEFKSGKKPLPSEGE
jgi:hypothetical protein